MAGAKSTSFLKLVIDGKRNISDDGISMVSKGLPPLRARTEVF
jgi:hypothetical protein